ncbi:MAG: thiamine pyrophosphate-dependent enzyme [Candidatus Omnitrophica bacterium]|nr:thiamine pyrophosphate-dependent enzyme [Candidatus Omnitrophota bacterium]
MATLKELSVKGKSALTCGHRMCAGCTAPIIIKMITLVSPTPVVVVCATGCLEVATTIFPYTAWVSPFVHNAFENAAATISGVETAYRALKKRGGLKEDIKFIAFGGDGGTYDIGLQALSGALERGHDFLYVCYTNEAYMNTGIQRSGATPRGAATTTCPAGCEIQGKSQQRKNLTEIAAAHEIPYVAQASPSHWQDLIKKSEKAFSIKGPKFMNVLEPCTLGWGFLPDQGIEVAKLAVETCFWPLYEIENGKYKLTYIPKEKKPVTEFLKTQRRFSHLFKEENKQIISQIQADVDKAWADLNAKRV